MKKWEIINNSKFKIQNSKFQELTEILLHNRDIKTKKEIKEFLNPVLENITPKNVGLNKLQLTKALKRIEKAISEKEHIIVFGDYDVDGITASAILWETLRAIGAEIMPYIPHRMDEGYGLSKIGIENAKLVSKNLKLIITVDNGIVANEAVKYANSQGIDVIITDHHLPENTKLPPAFAIVHTTKLCGAGIAYVLANEIKKERNTGKEKNTHLELATLGTIADLVPLTGANRAIAKEGLKKLRETTRPGLLALFEEAACGKENLGVYEVGHIIAPRLNAAGRLESAMDSLRLLCTKDANRARSLAVKLGRTNRERQEMMKESVTHASMTIRSKPIKKLLILGHETYQQGIIGLIAGRLVEEFYRPAIVLSIGEEYSKASVRSVVGFNIIEFLRKNQEFFVNLGGHPMAAGFTIETTKLKKLEKALSEMSEKILTDDLLTRRIKIDCELSLNNISPKLYEEIQKLSPFGMGNPEPVFVSRDVEVSDLRILGREGKHLKLMLHQENSPIFEAIAFGMGELAKDIGVGDKLSVAYTIDENKWNGNTKLQLKIKDLKSS